MLATKLDGVAVAKKPHIKGRNGDDRSLQSNHGLPQAREIRSVGRNGEVRVAAKFGRAVKHARLPAHEQDADAVRAH